MKNSYHKSDRHPNPRQPAESIVDPADRRIVDILESISDAFFSLDDDLAVTYFNRAAERLLKRDKSEVLGRDLFDAFPEARGSIFEEKYRQALRDKQATSFETYFDVPPYENWYAVNVYPRSDGISVFFQTITERKKMEQTLRESEERHRTLFETMVQGVVYQNAEGEITSANPAAERILGLSLDQIQGKTSSDPGWRAIQEDGSDFPGDRHPSMVALRTGRKVRDVIMGIIKPGQRDHTWIRINAVPLFRAGEEKPHQVYTTFEDITVQKRAQEAVRESEGRYRELFNSIPSGVAVYEALDDGADFIFVDFNQAAERIEGVQREDLVGQRVTEAFPGVKEFGVFEVFQRVWRTGQAEHFPRALYKDQRTPGTWRESWVYRLPDGQIVSVYNVIDARVKAEQALRENERRLSTLMSNLPGMAYRCYNDRDWTMRFVSEGCLDLTGYSPQELIQQAAVSYGQLIHPDDRQQVWDQVQSALDGNRPFELTYRIHTAGGEEKWVWERGRAVDTSQGVQILEGFVSDITDRVRAEEELREMTDRFQSVIQASPAAIVTLDREGRVELWNPAAERIFGWTAEEILGHPFPAIPPNKEKEYRGFLDVIFEGKTLDAVEIRRRTKDGTPIDISLSAAPLYDATRQIVGAMGINLDISARKRAERTLQRYTQHLEALRQIGLELVSELNLDDLLRSIATRAIELVHGSSGGLYLFRPERKVLEWAVSVGPNLAPVGTTLGRGEGLSGRVWETGKALIVDDMRHWEGKAAQYRDYDWQAVVAVPIRWGPEFLGVLNVLAETPGAFSDDDADLLRLFAAQAAVAIQNAHLFEQMRAARERSQTLTQQLVEAQEQERRHISRELHDEIGQALTMTKINLQALQQTLDTAAPAPHLQESIDLVSRTLQQVRDLSLDLRPSLLDDLGLVPALRWYLDRQAQQTQVSIQLVNELPEERLPPTLAVTCFRIAQEALTNLLRHADAKRVEVTLRQADDGLQLLIRDDGQGFNPRQALQRAVRGHSSGLLGMQERATLAGGTLEIESAPGQGTEIQARFPPASPPAEGREERPR